MRSTLTSVNTPEDPVDPEEPSDPETPVDWTTHAQPPPIPAFPRAQPNKVLFRVGDMELQCDACDSGFEPGDAVNLYLRPEDRIAEHLGPDTPNRLNALVTKVEFLGGLCIAEVTADELHGQSLGLHFSLNQLHDLDIREVNRIDIALRANRIRAFCERKSKA